MKRLFNTKGARGLSPLDHGVKGGRIQTLILRGVPDPLGNGGDLQIWDTSFRGFFDDGIVDQNDNSRRRLRQFMGQNGPTHPVADEKTGLRRLIQYVFGHLEVAIHRSILQRDTNECGSEGSHALKLGLEGLIRDEFGDRLWKPELGIRVAIVAHDLEPDVVLIKLGRGIDVPDVDDQAVADVSITVIDGSGQEQALRLPTWKYYEGRPGHLCLIEKPRAIYPGSAYFMVASQDELASVVIPAWGNGGSDEVVRVGIDLNRKIGLAETRNGLMGQEVLPEQPEPGVEVYRFEQPGFSPIPGGQPQSLVISIQHLKAAATIPTPVITPEASVAEPAVPVAAPSPVLPLAYEEEPTIVVGPRPGVATSLLGLEVMAIALPKVDGGSGVSHWCLQIDGDGNIIRGKDGGTGALRIGASAAKPGLSMILPGQTGWQQVNAPISLQVAGGALVWLNCPSTVLTDVYLGYLELNSPVTLTLPSGRHIFGRSGCTVDNKLAIGLLMQPGSLKVDGSPSSNSMEYLGLSRDHLALCVEGNVIRVEILGKTPAWRLNGDLEVEEELLPGTEDCMNLAEDDHLLVGPYLLRTIRI